MNTQSILRLSRLCVPTLRLFSSSYKPLRPLQPFTILYQRPQPTHTHRILPLLPSVCLFLNNLLTGFTILNTGALFAVLFAGQWYIWRSATSRARIVYRIETTGSFKHFRFWVYSNESSYHWATLSEEENMATVNVGRREIAEADVAGKRPEEFKDVMGKVVGLKLQITRDTSLINDVRLLIDLGVNQEKKHEDYLLALLTGKQVILK